MSQSKVSPRTVDDYLKDGCGRCEHYQTPACKVHPWFEALTLLRETLLAVGLTETLKWGSPCYVSNGRNVAMLVSLKASCALAFNEGAALRDDAGWLRSPGPHSRYARYLRFASAEAVRHQLPVIRDFLTQAIAHATSGTRFQPEATPEPLPDELAQRLALDEALHRAFYALTPGRQRSHILHISGAKQAETRARRVTACTPDILAGRGFKER